MIDRVGSLVHHYGEDFSVGAANYRGVFSNMTTGTARAYLTGFEIDTAILPIWCCLVPPDTSIAIDDLVSWNSLPLTVKKILEARYKAGVVAKMLVLVQYT
ncbi:MAG: hypothetical protein JNM34_07730 [Chthonomonadaceae bacterium]|nr:hypothetical protein [Chthonomonadaceae bacterium]